jgi:hypothetical protein
MPGDPLMTLSIIYNCVGTTRSGKMIPYTSSVNDIGSIIIYFKESSFSPDDLLDAFAVFDYLALRGLRRGDEMAIFDRIADGIQNVFDPQENKEAKRRANIKSAFDLRDLGKSLASIEFADF